MGECNSPDQRPLAGLRVLDLTQALAGPYCTMMLADAGAEVLKIEPVRHGDHVRGWRQENKSISPYFLAANRSKKSVAIDLKAEEGRKLLLALAQKSDVIVENFRPGVMERLGLGYAEVRRAQPGIIYCSVSGFGQTGPLATRPAYDLIASGYGGSMSVTGEAGGAPCKPGIPAADIMAAMTAAYSLMLALKLREKTGTGQKLDVAMVDTQVSAMAYHILNYQMAGVMPSPMGSANPLMAPYQSFKTADKAINIAVLNDKQWAAFCCALGKEDWLSKPDFSNQQARLKSRDALCQQISEELAKNGSEFWLQTLSAAGVPCGLIRGVVDILEDSELEERGMLVSVELDGEVIKVPGAPWKGDGVSASNELPPELGSSTFDILHNILGITDAELDELSVSGVIQCQ